MCTDNADVICCLLCVDTTLIIIVVVVVGGLLLIAVIVCIIVIVACRCYFFICFVHLTLSILVRLCCVYSKLKIKVTWIALLS